MDNAYYEFRDDARPFFQRKNCEAGIYISIYDATAIDKRSFGLEHFFFMKSMDLLYQECCNTDLVKIRAALVQRGVLKDCYMERFEPGIVLAIGFDRLDSLDELWNLHRNNKLQPILHEILVTPAILKTLSCKHITLDVKLWDDEYDDCRKELLNKVSRHDNIRDNDRDMKMVKRLKDYQGVLGEEIHETPKQALLQTVKIQMKCSMMLHFIMVYTVCNDRDMKMVKRLKDYQGVLGEEIQTMRDLENEMDLKRSEFTAAVHRNLPEDKNSIDSLKEFIELVNASKSSKLYNRQSIDQYVYIIRHWRSYFHTLELEVVTPLLQIHQSCENAEQKEIKRKIVKHVQDMQKHMKHDANLQMVVHPEMEKKIPRREAPLFLGLLSLVPLGADKVADIDILIDDYMRHYKFEEDF